MLIPFQIDDVTLRGCHNDGSDGRVGCLPYFDRNQSLMLIGVFPALESHHPLVNWILNYPLNYLFPKPVPAHLTGNGFSRSFLFDGPLPGEDTPLHVRAPIEGQMIEEMGEALLVLGLVERTGGDHEAEGGAGAGLGVGADSVAQAVGRLADDEGGIGGRVGGAGRQGKQNHLALAPPAPAPAGCVSEFRDHLSAQPFARYFAARSREGTRDGC